MRCLCRHASPLSAIIFRDNAASPRSQPTYAPQSQPNTAAGRLFAIPVNDPESSYQYPEQVRLELAQEDEASYERAADFLNFNGNDLVCLHIEYGIFGGVAGGFILTLLRKLKMPLVVTLHTVLREPDPHQRAVLAEIAQLSDRLVVMSEQSVRLLRMCTTFHRKRSTSFLMVCRTFHSWIRITSRICSMRRESPYC